MLSILAIDSHNCPVAEIGIEGVKNLDFVKVGLYGMDIGMVDYISYKGMRREMCGYGGGIREYDTKFIKDYVKTLENVVDSKYIDEMIETLSNPIKSYRVVVYESV